MFTIQKLDVWQVFKSNSFKKVVQKDSDEGIHIKITTRTASSYKVTRHNIPAVLMQYSNVNRNQDTQPPNEVSFITTGHVLPSEECHIQQVLGRFLSLVS